MPELVQASSTEATEWAVTKSFPGLAVYGPLRRRARFNSVDNEGKLELNNCNKEHIVIPIPITITPSDERHEQSGGDDAAASKDPSAAVSEGLAGWLSDVVDARNAFLAKDPTVLNHYLKRAVADGSVRGRERDILPISPPTWSMAGELCEDLLALPAADGACTLKLACAAIDSLNVLYGCRCPVRRQLENAAQRAAVGRILAKCVRLVRRLRDVKLPDSVTAFGTLIGDPAAGGGGVPPRLRADMADLLPNGSSGRVDPMPFIDEASRQIVTDPARLFGGLSPGDCQARPMARADRAEYARLVLRQLRSHKVRLQSAVNAGASVFFIGKKGKDTLREIWNGHWLSQRAARAPAPPHLATPSAFLNIEARPETPLRIWKRDAQCFFDQLALPVALRAWFGRPPLALADLTVYGGASRDELQYFCDGPLPNAGALVHPVCCTWSMGFSWSSFIAQSTLLAKCRDAGLTDSRMLADDLPPPARGLTYGLATDDVMIFDAGGSGLGQQAANRLDKVLGDAGLLRNCAKDVDDVECATCIGVDISAGRFAGPNAARLCVLAGGLSHILRRRPTVSPDELAAVLGQCAWFALLARGSFSALHKVYDYSTQGGTVRGDVPPDALGELAVFLGLLPLLEADLARNWQGCTVACDASQAYGFGVSVANTAPNLTRKIAHSCMVPAAFLRLDRRDEHPDSEPERPRKGTPTRIPLTRSSFRTVISSRAGYKAHSGTLEATGLALALRWTLRSTQRHGKRTLLLVDARTVLGAASKGRSSAPTLRRQMMRVGALTLAGDLHLYFGYIPSEENPADAPSRGIVRRWRPMAARTWRQVKHRSKLVIQHFI